jgi:TetR/AcrR family transcriptional regulator, regulator of mycofactocin system
MSFGIEGPARGRGRPRRTSHADVAAKALDLFARNGFEQTTVDDIAAALGIGRRTVFRYFPSKNDIVWGDFDWVLDRLRFHLAEADELPIMDAVAHAAVSSNRYTADQLPELRIRMTLITTVPALQAHSMVRYAAWRGVIAEYVAGRLYTQPDDLVPLTVGYAALGTSMAAFSRWVDHPEESLDEHLRRGYQLLVQGLAPGTSGRRSRRRTAGEVRPFPLQIT